MLVEWLKSEMEWKVWICHSAADSVLHSEESFLLWKTAGKVCWTSLAFYIVKDQELWLCANPHNMAVPTLVVANDHSFVRDFGFHPTVKSFSMYCKELLWTDALTDTWLDQSATSTAIQLEKLMLHWANRRRYSRWDKARWSVCEHCNYGAGMPWWLPLAAPHM